MQLELFPPGPDAHGPEPDSRKIAVEKTGHYGQNERWMCLRCRRGGMSLMRISESQLRYARERHRCRPFYTDALPVEEIGGEG